MELPKERSKATKVDPKLLLIYGPPKVGKTTELAKLENNLLIDIEDGSDFVDALKVKVHSLKEFAELGEQIKSEGKPYKYVSIDVLDVIEDWAEKEATITYKNSVIGKNFDGKSVLELSKGGGYYYLRNAFFKIIFYAQTLADHVILVAHLKDTNIEKKGREVSAKDINLTGKIKSMLSAKCDAIGYIYRDEDDEGNSKVMVTFESSDEVLCGARSPHLKGQTFEFDWSKIFVEQ